MHHDLHIIYRIPAKWLIFFIGTLHYLSFISFYVCFFRLSIHLFGPFTCYSPSNLPATLSTASFKLKAAFPTTSLSSSPHSAMKVAVSLANPEKW